MKSYLLERPLQINRVMISQDRLEARVHIPEPGYAKNPSAGKYEVVTLERWAFPILGRMGYHHKTGTVFHTYEFPVGEWLLVEILCNLAEQYKAAEYRVSIQMRWYRWLRVIWWLSKGVLLDQLLTQNEQVEWDEKWAERWAKGGFAQPDTYPDINEIHTFNYDLMRFKRCFPSEP